MLSAVDFQCKLRSHLSAVAFAEYVDRCVMELKVAGEPFGEECHQVSHNFVVCRRCKYGDWLMLKDHQLRGYEITMPVDYCADHYP